MYSLSCKAFKIVWGAGPSKGPARARLSLVLILPFFLSVFLASSAHAADEVKLKILAVNPSAEKNIESDVTYPMPPEITPGDVLDAAGLDVKYDPEEKIHYLVGKVKLAPKESKTLTVTVRDVWKITPERIEQARAEINQKYESLKTTKFAETGELLYQKAMGEIDQIEAEQAQVQGIRRRIEFYRASVQRLADAQNNILSIGSLRELEAGAAEERTAKFQITAANPSAEPRTMTIRADLPKEVQSEHVLDKAGFTLLFDSMKSRFVLEKKEEFKGKENKTYQIVLKDIWFIPAKEIEYIRKQTENLAKHFVSSNYADYAAGLTSEIERLLTEIETLQAEVADTAAIQDRIRAFTLNSQKMNIVKAKVKELQDLLLELPIKAETEDDLAKYLEGIRELQKVKETAKLLSMGLKPDLSTTWWIILTIIVFLMFLATLFYTTWLKKLKKDIYATPPKDKSGPDSGDNPTNTPS